MANNRSTYVSYISGIGAFKSFIADYGRELPTSNPVMFSDADFAKYVARKAAFKRVVNDLKAKAQARDFLTMATFPGMGPNANPVKKFKTYLDYVISKPFSIDDLHHYALAPNNPTKYSKNARVVFMAQAIRTVLKNDPSLDATFSVIQQAFEVLQSDQNGKGAFYFLYLFVPKEKAEQVPAVAKKQAAQEKTLKLLSEGLGVELDDLKMFVRRITRRNLSKEPEALINELAKKNILSVPGTSATPYQNLTPQQQAAFAAQMQDVRGNANIGEPITLALIALAGVIITATATVIGSVQQRKLEEARLSIKPENMPTANDFPATMMPINDPNSGGNGGGFLDNLTNQTGNNNTMLLLALAAAAALALSN